MRRARRATAGVAVAVLAAVAACCGDDGRAEDGDGRRGGRRSSTTAAAPPATGGLPGADVSADDPLPRLRLREVASFDEPLALAVRPSDDAVFVAEKRGRVRALDGGEVVLDLSREVSDGAEQGLLGLAFSPDGAKMYVNYTDLEGDTHVVEFEPGGRARREILRVDQPYSNHNGGHLVFGPDGFLYVGLGDGGAAGDPQGNAQDLSTPLGKILRLDPRPSGGRPFTVPPDNPFVRRAGADPLVWAWGLRNPWRFSFDRASGDLWVADVGQGDWEEVSVIAAGDGGRNLGWDRLEGTRRFEGDPPPDALAPVHEYDHSGGACSVTGGHVVRDPRLAGLNGAYLFGDFCDGDVRVLRRDGDRWRATPSGLNVPQLAAFGEGPSGELYVLSLDGAVSRIEAR